jgi:hypothetical protein
MATLEGFAALIHAGKIRYFGVSNFDVADIEDLWSQPGGSAAVTDQVLYNLTRRGIEWDLLPWCRARPADHGLLAIEQGQLLAHPVLQSVAVWHGATAAPVALRGCCGTATRLRSRGPGTRVTCGRIAPRSTFGSRHRIWPRSIAHSRRQQGRSRSRCSKLGACRPNKRPA